MSKVEEKYVLYILKINKIKAFKIGITSADRYKIRFKEIEATFGQIDIKNSIFYKSNSMKTIKNLEKSLHLLLWENSKNLDKRKNGSGHTEFFSLNLFDKIKKLVNTMHKENLIKIEGPFFLENKKVAKSFGFLKIIYILFIVSVIVYNFKENIYEFIRTI